MCANLVTVAGDPSRAGVNGCFDDILEVLHTDKRIMAMCQLLQHNSFLLRGSSQLRSTEFHGSDPPPIVQQSDMSFWRIWSVYMAWTVVLTPPPPSSRPPRNSRIPRDAVAVACPRRLRGVGRRRVSVGKTMENRWGS